VGDCVRTCLRLSVGENVCDNNSEHVSLRMTMSMSVTVCEDENDWESE
jgi:hypothetical protein